MNSAACGLPCLQACCTCKVYAQRRCVHQPVWTAHVAIALSQNLECSGHAPMQGAGALRGDFFCMAQVTCHALGSELGVLRWSELSFDCPLVMIQNEPALLCTSLRKLAARRPASQHTASDEVAGLRFRGMCDRCASFVGRLTGQGALRQGYMATWPHGIVRPGCCGFFV